MKIKKVTKLFYGKYRFKISLSTKLNFLFSSYYSSGKRYARANTLVKEFEERLKGRKVISHKHWSATYEIKYEDVVEAKKLLEFIDTYDCKTRNDFGYRLSFFTNSIEVLKFFKNDKMGKDMAHSIYEIDNSLLDFLISNPKLVIVEEEPEFEYKVYLKGHIDPSFANWLEANTDKSKVGDITLQCIKTKRWLSGNYFFVRDEKVLDLTRLIVGHNITKVDRLVYRGNIDKYMHANDE